MAALLPSDAPTSGADMARRADVAMYIAKRNGKHRIDVGLQLIQRSNGELFGFLGTLTDLRAVGVFIAVANFGAGYGSIARLHAL